jgi:hypothetical protein
LCGGVLGGNSIYLRLIARRKRIMTNTEASQGWKRYRLLPIVMALTCVFLWGAMFARLADRQIGVNKDWLFLYLCGIEIVQPQLHEQQIDLVKKIVAASGDDHTVYRATMRANYCNNYPFTSLSMYMAGKWQTWFGTSAAEDFPAFLVRSLWYGIVVSGELLGILTILAVFALTRGPLRTSLFMAIGLAAFFYLVMPPPRTNWFLYQGTPSPPAMLVNWLNVLGLGLHSWLHPAAPYSAFSTFPRSLCAVLSFAAFAIRWSGRPVAAYWMPLLISGVHQSTSLLLLFVLICCDAAIRPRILVRAAILVPIGVNLAIIFLRERMFAILGFSSTDVFIVAGLTLFLAGAFAMLPPVRAVVRAGWLAAEAWQRRTFEAVPLPFADALITFAAWLVLILISYLASRNDAWYRLIYFWSELSPRYIGMFQLSFIAGLLFPLIVMLQSARPVASRWGTASVAAVMLAMAVSQIMAERSEFAPQILAAQRFDKMVSEQRDAYAGGAVPTMRDETSWYYVLIRSAILGDRSLSAFFGKT